MGIIVTLSLPQSLTPEQLLFSLLPASAEGWGELPLCAGAKQTLNFTQQDKMPGYLALLIVGLMSLNLFLTYSCFYNESPDSLSLREIFVRMNDEGRGMFMGGRRKG